VVESRPGHYIVWFVTRSHIYARGSPYAGRCYAPRRNVTAPVTTVTFGIDQLDRVQFGARSRRLDEQVRRARQSPEGRPHATRHRQVQRRASAVPTSSTTIGRPRPDVSRSALAGAAGLVAAILVPRGRPGAAARAGPSWRATIRASTRGPVGTK